MDIGLKSVKELLDMNFFIPNYQRGYRWTEQQVKDLLNDINEFAPNEKSKFYCLQPVVVKDRTSEKDILSKVNEKKGDFTKVEEIKQFLRGEYEVIDGQQRLTTIFLILKYLRKENSFEKEIPFTLNYNTRKDSANFLIEIEGKDDTSASVNIDYYHILQAYKCIKDWFGEFHDNNENIKETFKKKLLAQTKFIWYESDEEDPIKVFTRLNMWKIPLTNAELVKALFLNKRNFGEDTKLQRLKQQEIAMQWDEIEYALWNNDMWFFFKSENRPTHIDVILDIVCDEDKGTKDDLGNDEYKTFRYFYKLKEGGALLEKWKQIKEIFQTLKDWYDDIECYHYVSFLVENGVNVQDLLSNRKKEKNDFIKYLKDKIKEKIKECKDLDKQYEIDGPNKTTCRPLLLLHNVQTVINQAKNIKEKYGNKSFTRFPFYIYKKENWDIEHIDSNTSNKLNDEKSQKEWLCNRYNAVDEDKQKKIMDFFEHDNNSIQEFEELVKNLNISTEPKLSDEEKNQIMNFVLLDANTNRGYKNAIFPAKRRMIIGKEKGENILQPTIKEDGKLDKGATYKGKSSFIPPCTKNVFLKYYSPAHTNPNYWTKDDALAYRNDIHDTLKKFLNKEEQDNVQ